MNNIALTFKQILLGSVAVAIFAIPQTYAANKNSTDKNATAKKTTKTAKTTKTTESALTEIVVTGIRGSQMRALQTKRFASSIVDAIAAEDIGKFADSNISEALQRIPGVTISRAGGEGQFVTVRGMGPAFNTVLYNGRVLATENDGREFSFDVIPAELINSVEVYKTAPTDLIEGGIGATINMKTARPLDNPGLHGAASVKGLYDTNSKKAQPQFSGVISDTFMDGKFGILGSFSYNKRKFQNERVFTDGFEANQTLNLANGKQIKGVSLPTFASFDVNRSNRKRVSGALTLQWQVNDDLLITLDGLYSKLDVRADSRSLFFYGGPGDITKATVDANNTVTSFQGKTQERIVTFIRPRFAKTREAGFNAQWQANDHLSAVFDAAYSKSTDSTAGNQAWFDSNLNISQPSQITYNQTPAGSPSFSNIGNLSDTSKAKFGWFTWEGRSISDTTYQSTFDLTYAFDDAGALTSVKAGTSYAQREKIKTVAKTPGNVQCLFCGVPIPQNQFSTISSKFLNGGVSNNSFPTYSVSALQAYFLSNAGLNAAAINKAGSGASPAAIATALASIKAAIAANGGTLGVQPVPGAGGGVREKNYDAYIQADFMGNFSDDLPWSGNIGLRYTRTKVLSSGVGQKITAILTPPNSDPVPVFTKPVPIQEAGSYHVWLPNANFKLGLYKNVVFRAAIGRTLTRATLSDLILARNYNVRKRARNVSSGNPGLKPMTAWNYDTNLTWYIDDASYLSVALFHKTLTNESRRQTKIIKILGFNFSSNRPENLGHGTVNGFSLSAQYSFRTLPAPFDGLGVQANYTYVKQKTDGVVNDQTSKTYNLVGFYQKGPIQARIAYNYRAGYLASLHANRGQPKNIRAYGQWDASISYDLPWYGLSVFAQAINITNAQTLSYSIYQNRVIQLQDTGARYISGVRIKF